MTDITLQLLLARLKCYRDRLRCRVLNFVVVAILAGAHGTPLLSTGARLRHLLLSDPHIRITITITITIIITIINSAGWPPPRVKRAHY